MNVELLTLKLAVRHILRVLTRSPHSPNYLPPLIFALTRSQAALGFVNPLLYAAWAQNKDRREPHDQHARNHTVIAIHVRTRHILTHIGTRSLQTCTQACTDTTYYSYTRMHTSSLALFASFNDIVKGSNRCTEGGCLCQSGFDAAPGWDAATGLGTPNFGVLTHTMDQILSS